MYTPPGGHIGFGTGSSASFTEAMRITANGDVGIGISFPASSRLSVEAGSNEKYGIYAVAAGDTSVSVYGGNSTGIGVIGATTSGIGVYGSSSSGGDAGYFFGNVTVSGNICALNAWSSRTHG